MFAKNLKYLRAKRGYDQQTFAEMIHRSVSTVSEWESGKYTPKAGILADIANMFGVKLDDMMNKDLSKSKCENKRIYNSIKQHFVHILCTKISLPEQGRQNDKVLHAD